MFLRIGETLIPRESLPEALRKAVETTLSATGNAAMNPWLLATVGVSLYALSQNRQKNAEKDKRKKSEKQ